MNILYVRVSSLDQNTDRQRVNEKDFSYIIEDRCSGAIPFFEREGAVEINKLLKKKAISKLSVYSIDRLGRNLKDILNTIEFFNERNIPIQFLSQGLCTLDSEGKENPVSKLIISILGIVGEMERVQIRERQFEGIKIAKAKGIYLGRKEGSTEDLLQFLNKPKNKQVVDYLKKGYKHLEISKIVGVNINTITKIKKKMAFAAA